MYIKRKVNKMYNNPLIPGDPYMYDVKWIIAKLKELITGLENLEIPSDVDITNIVNTILANKETAVVNVKDYGAKGDGLTDDRESIISAISGAESINSWLYFPAGTYLISAGITVPHTLNILMDGYIHYNGTGAAVTVGEQGTSYNNAIQNWRISGLSAINSGSVGLEIKNANSCLIYLDNISKFEIGVKLNGNGAGFQNNTILIGTIGSFTTGLLLNSESSGWINDNIYIKGRFFNPSSHTWTSTAIKIDSSITNRLNNNNNFYNPNIEQNNVGINIAHGAYNHFYDVRTEAVATAAIISDSISESNIIEIGYGNISTINAKNMIIGPRTSNKLFSYKKSVFNFGGFEFNSASNASRGTIKDIWFASYGNFNNYGAENKFTLDSDNNIELPGSRCFGARFKIDSDKPFAINISSKSSPNLRPYIIMFDANGQPITTIDNFAQANFSSNNSFGFTGFIASATNSAPAQIPAECKELFAGFATAGASSIRQLCITIADANAALIEHTPVLNAIPTINGVAVGQICYDSAGGFWLWTGSAWVHS